jgi:hypothetical protein
LTLVEIQGPTKICSAKVYIVGRDVKGAQAMTEEFKTKPSRSSRLGVNVTSSHEGCEKAEDADPCNQTKYQGRYRQAFSIK